MDFYIINLDAKTMLECKDCELEFTGKGPKSDVIFEEFCPKCGSYEIFVKNSSNPIIKPIIGWTLLFLFVSAILLPLIWYIFWYIII